MICARTLCSFLVLATFSLWGCDPDEPSPPADQAVPDGPVDKLDGSVDRAAPDKKLPDASLPDQVLPDQVLPDQMLPDMPPPSCTDGKKNGDETDIDCGGKSCPACGKGKGCTGSADCNSGVCTAGKCQEATCSDGVKNGDETDADCGGPTCSACANSKKCLKVGDCKSGICTAGVCLANWKLLGVMGANLVRVETAAAKVSIVGGFGVSSPMAHLAFDGKGGVLYGLADINVKNNIKLFQINPCTGKATQIAVLKASGKTLFYVEGFAFDDKTAKLYCSVNTTSGSTPYSETLATIDPASGTLTLLGKIKPTLQNEADGLTFVNGTLYARDGNGTNSYHYTLNPASGARILALGQSKPARTLRDMTHHPKANKIYGVTGTNGSWKRHLVEVSMPSVSLVDIGSYSSSGVISGLAAVNLLCVN